MIGEILSVMHSSELRCKLVQQNVFTEVYIDFLPVGEIQLSRSKLILVKLCNSV